MDFGWLWCVSVGSSGGDVDNGGGRGMWEISAPSSQFCCEPKTALKKNKVY